MALMMELKGVPPVSVIKEASRRKAFFDQDYNTTVEFEKYRRGAPNSKKLPSLMRTTDMDFVNFIDVSVSILRFSFILKVLM